MKGYYLIRRIYHPEAREALQLPRSAPFWECLSVFESSLKAGRVALPLKPFKRLDRREAAKAGELASHRFGLFEELFVGGRYRASPVPQRGAQWGGRGPLQGVEARSAKKS